MSTVTVQAEGGVRAGFSPRAATVLLASCMFMSAAAGLVNEYILSTVSTYILGNSIEQFSIIIAVMMVMMGLAGWVQKHVSDSDLVEKFVGVEVALAIMGGFAPIATYAAFGLMDTHFALVQYTFVGSIGFLIGFEIPLLLRVNKRYSETLQSNLASILSFDYIGSFVGALVWIYFLLRTFPLTEISFIVAGSNLLVAIVALMYFMRHGLVKRRLFCIVLMTVTAAATAFGFVYNREWNATLEQKLYEEPIVFAATTRYQRIVVTHDNQLDDWRLFLNGNVQLSSLDEARYHELLVHPVMELAPSREHVLILGGGDGLALREVLKYKDVRSITLVDLDPEMTRLAKEEPTLRKLNGDAFRDARVHVMPVQGITDDGWQGIWQENGRKDKYGLPQTERVAMVNVFNVDADRFVGALTGRRWDVAIVDFPDPNAIELTKLYSKEFYLKLRQRSLSPTGMISVQSTSPYHAKEAYLCIGRTLEAAGFRTIPYHENIPSFGDWGWYLGWPQNGANPDDDAVRAAIRSSSGFEVETTYLTPDVLRRSLIFGKGELEAERSEVNTLMHPVLLDTYVRHGWLVD